MSSQKHIKYAEALDSDDEHDYDSDTSSANQLGPERENGDDVDLDVPRVAQWEPDDFEVDGPNPESESDDDTQDEFSNPAGPSQIQLVCCLRSFYDLHL